MSALESSPLLLLAMLGAMALTAKVLLTLRPTLLAPDAGRSSTYPSIAGLRGLLAASVFVHHAQVARLLFRDGAWLPLQSPVYTFAGTGSVGIFFMITGLLFWGKLVDGTIRLTPLLRSRVRRILPLYMLGFVLILAICAYDSKFSLSGTWTDLGLSIFRWLGGGLFGSPEINGIGTVTINGGVTWTLRYEWIFYLALPFLIAFGPPWRFALLVTGFLMALVGLKKFGHESGYQALVVAVPFIGGMLAAYVVRSCAAREFPKSWFASTFVAASFVLGALAYVPGYFTIVAVALFPAFAAIALGNDIFGLLKFRWVVFLGEISFSIYLLHGIVVLAALRVINGFVSVGQVSYYGYALICVGLSATVVMLSTVTFVLVEKPFMGNREATGRGGKPAILRRVHAQHGLKPTAP